MNQPRVKNRKIYLILAGIVIAFLAFYGGYDIASYQATKTFRAELATIHPVRENNQEYHFIYPLLLYNFGDIKSFFEDKTLEGQIADYVNAQYAAGNASSVSVSVRSFVASGWAGFNQNAQYQPGSMLKVLLMMAWYREAEKEPEVLSAQLVYTAAVDQETNSLAFHQPTELVVGKSYAVDDLLRIMIADSDNGAETLLINNVDRPTLNQAYIDLGVPSPDNTTSTYTLSTDQYMDFLRVLYNSTYLSERYSEESLSIMSQSSFTSGIASGVPSGVVVAHKYGERVDTDASGAVQAIELHDCGIVYPAGGPYAVCVMTKGADEGKLTQVLQGVSKLVYDYEESRTQ